MSEEPLFGVYLHSRNDTPDSVDEIHQESFEFEKIPADKVIRGWNNLEEFLDESNERYYWKEAEPESAPARIICERCEIKEKTHSEERLQHLRSMHHISTGH
jgi:hypothetical protein